MAGGASDLIIRLLVDDKQLDKVDNAQNRFDAFGDGLGIAARGATVAVAAIGAAAVVTGVAASEAQQAAGAVTSVFGEYASEVEGYAATSAEAVGLSAAAYSQMAATMGAQLGNMGLAQEEVAGQTNELITLGADLAATFGGSTSDAVGALSALLRGEADPIEQYGVSIKEATINAKLAEMGLADLEGEAATAARTQALLALVTEQTAGAQGQFAREADSAAGSTQIMQAQWADAAAQLGQVLLPVVSAGAAALGDFANWAGENAGLVQGLAVGALVLAGAIIAANAAFKGLVLINGIVAALTAFRAAQAAGTTATIAQTAAQWANNAAWLASPVTWIILAIIVAIGLLVAAVIWLATNWDSVIQWISGAWTWLWESILQPIFNGIATVFTWIYQNIIYPIIVGIMLYIGLWAAAITFLWEAVISPVFNFIGAIFQWIWSSVISPVVGWIVEHLNFMGAGFRMLYANYVQPAFNGVASALQWVWGSIIKPTFDAIVGAIRWVGNTVSSVFGGIGRFVGNAFSQALNFARGPINGLISLVNGAIYALNGLSVSIPDWVPVVGGQTWGLSLPTIPMLANGGITNGPMLAWIGDNPGGREVVEPLSSYERRLDRAYQEGASSGGDVQVLVTQKVTGVSLDELIDIRIVRAGQERKVKLSNGRRKG